MNIVVSCIKRRLFDPSVNIHNMKYTILLHKKYRVHVNPRYSPSKNVSATECFIFGTNVKVCETRFGYYVKPTKPHNKSQFEEFFEFGRGNAEYNGERTIFVPK